MDIGEKIHQLRLEKGWTLEELGEKVGVGKSTIKRWESGIIANMRRDKIALIANAFGVSPTYLMGWEDKKTAIVNEKADSEGLLIYAEILSKLNTEGQQEALKRIQELTELSKYRKGSD